MSATDDLTPDEIATLKDTARRIMARRSRGVRTGASVQRNNWTEAEALLSGARADLQASEHAFANAQRAYEAARIEFEQRQHNVQIHRTRVEALQRRVLEEQRNGR